MQCIGQVLFIFPSHKRESRIFSGFWSKSKMQKIGIQTQVFISWQRVSAVNVAWPVRRTKEFRVHANIKILQKAAGPANKNAASASSVKMSNVCALTAFSLSCISQIEPIYQNSATRELDFHYFVLGAIWPPFGHNIVTVTILYVTNCKIWSICLWFIFQRNDVRWRM